MAGWLGRRDRSDARLEALELELVRMRLALEERAATVQALVVRVAAAERTAADAAAGAALWQRRVGALVRAMRAGGVRLGRLAAAADAHGRRNEEMGELIARLRASIAVLAARADADAMEARKTAMGLLERLSRREPRDAAAGR